MATLILKSLATGYILTAVGIGVIIVISDNAPLYAALFMPVFAWPAILIVSGLALLVFKAIDENKK